MMQAKSETTDASAAGEQADDWMSIPERGGVFGIYFFAVLATMFGRTIPRLFLWVVVGYYYVFAAGARRASREYHERLLGEVPSRWECYQHLLRFGQVALDRLFFARGQLERFDFERHGHEHLEELRREEGGALLMGAHLGSFAAMKGAASGEDLPVNALTYNANSKIINGVIQKLDPEARLRVIDLGEDRIQGILTVRDRLEDGEFVALLSDRVGVNDKFVEVDFLGETAQMPIGGFLLASMLKCPVYLVFGLYRGRNDYELHCEPFRDKVELPRGDEREDALREVTQAYADRLEAYCHKAPDNWFNFYDYWGSD